MYIKWNFNSKIFEIIFGKRYFFLFIIIINSILTGCKDLISIDGPNNSVNGINVYSKDETAIAVITNIYAKISSDNRYSFGSAGQLANSSLYAGLSADELTLFNIGNTTLNLFYTNSLSANYSVLVWSYDYSIIFLANSAIEGLSNNTQLTPAIQKQLLGEAKFIRAFCYFYLVNFYGDVPLVLSTDPLVNASLPRSPKESVYTQIVSDLKSSQELLSENYLAGNLSSITQERVRPTRWAATALLSRVYLYLSDYKNAENEATKLIDNIAYFSLDSLNQVFIKNSNESIWQLQCVSNTAGNTGDGNYFVLPTNGPNTSDYPVYLSSHIVNSFETGDLRRKYWTDSTVTSDGVYYYPYKYKSSALSSGDVSEYLMVFRLAEQYLIRAEARMQQSKLSDCLSDLNVLRKRAGIPLLNIGSKDSMLIAIVQERKVELFTEWGHRWLDLKRLNLVNNLMQDITNEKGGAWNSNWQLYPINTTELQSDPYLIQNDGY